MNPPMIKFPIALSLGLLSSLTVAIPQTQAAPQLRKIHSSAVPARAFRGQTMSIGDGSFAFAQEVTGAEGDRPVQRLGYIWYANQVRPIAMTNGKERITSFSIVGSQGNSAFLSASYQPAGATTGSPQEALFWTTGNRLQMLIGPGTLLPGGDRVKTFKTAEVGLKGIAFVAIGQSGKKGIYLVTRKGIERIVDQTTLIPGKNLTEFNISQLSLSGKNVAFSGVFGSSSNRQGGIYAYRSGKLEQVVDAGNRVAVESRSPDATITGNQVGLTGFPGQGLYESAGVYIQSASGKPLTTLANNKTVFPDRPEVPNSPVTSSSSNLCIAPTYSVFINENEGGRTMFVKTSAGLQKVVSVGDRLDNKVVKDIHASGRYCNSKQLGLAVEFQDEVAIYQVTPVLPAPPITLPPVP
ncbi:MAG: hypothetical protein HC860_24160 [Alkalinema sp. RU_4_3]|nr:hypothetical protein [Alkalinema sp. RU_4_3]